MNKFFAFLFLILFSIQGSSQYKNLVFEGGGIRGIAYAGVIKALEENGQLNEIEKTGGSSVGALAALMLSLGYTAKEIDSLMQSIKLQTFNDGQYIFVGGQHRLRKKFGWYKGNQFEHWVKQLIVAKTLNASITFKEFRQLNKETGKFKDFYCTGTNLSLQRAEIFSYETTPELAISTAVRISMSIPLYFEAVVLDENLKRIQHTNTSRHTNVYVDGGLLLNYPVAMFDTCMHSPTHSYCKEGIINTATLGIKLERPEQLDQYSKNDSSIAPFEIRNVKDYLSSFYNLAFENLNRAEDIRNEKGRTVYISTSNISPRIRKISREQKEKLYDNGYVATMQFMRQLNTKSGVAN